MRKRTSTKAELWAQIDQYEARTRHLDIEVARLAGLRDDWERIAGMERRERVRLEAIVAIVKNISEGKAAESISLLLTPIPQDGPPITLRERGKLG